MRLLHISAVNLLLVLSSQVLAQSYSGSWEPTDSKGFTQRRDLTASVIDGYIYAIGGDIGSADILEMFDPGSPVWSPLSPSGLFSPRGGHTASVIDGKIYLIGGGNSDGTPSAYIQVLDPVANRLRRDTIAVSHFSERYKHTATVVDNKIYCIGGVNSYPYTNDTVEVYDPATRSWSVMEYTGEFTPRLEHTASLIDRKIYIIGGHDGVDDVNSIQVLDIETATWSTIATTDGAIIGHCAIVYDNKIFIFGGYKRGTDIDVLVFDPQTLQWNTVPTTGVFTKRDRFATAQVGNKFYAIGGETKNVEVFTLTKSSVAHDNFSSITLTPNPTDGVCTVTNVPSPTRITITNVLGDIVLEATSSTFDLSHLPASLYNVIISTQDGMVSRKLVVK